MFRLYLFFSLWFYGSSSVQMLLIPSYSKVAQQTHSEVPTAHLAKSILIDFWMLFELKTSFRQGSLSSSLIRVYKSRNLVGLEFIMSWWSFNFKLPRQRVGHFYKHSKLEFKYFGARNTLHHIKKYTHTWLEVDGPYMTVSTGSMSPWCCRRNECIKAITPVSDPLSSL